MNSNAAAAARPPVIERLRAATGEAHRRLDSRMDAVAHLADPHSREVILRRYAAFHLPADKVFAALTGLPELELGKRSREPLLARFAPENPPPFPQPRNDNQALGMLYVTEGSTLGGRMILRELEKRGASDPALGFLDPYGSETGAMWRQFLVVLEREVGGDERLIGEACDGAIAAFAHAERVLCDGVGV